ncbi:MAG TPA: hypothetical protein VGN57_19130 [Pirellulaceae bacterium]|jgi:hypothetical protein|nr:hypothetical protein [Pirellulaceae bacterium]
MENKTSLAVDELFIRWSEVDETVGTAHNEKNCRAMQAIAQRFKRMEEALEFCKTTSSFESPDKFERCMKLIHQSAEEALAFDPLL